MTSQEEFFLIFNFMYVLSLLYAFKFINVPVKIQSMKYSQFCAHATLFTFGYRVNVEHVYVGVENSCSTDIGTLLSIKLSIVDLIYDYYNIKKYLAYLYITVLSSAGRRTSFTIPISLVSTHRSSHLDWKLTYFYDMKFKECITVTTCYLSDIIIKLL